MRRSLYFPNLIELIEKKSCTSFFKVIIIVIINFGQENKSIELNNLDVYLQKIIFHYQTIFPLSTVGEERIRRIKILYCGNYLI